MGNTGHHALGERGYVACVPLSVDVSNVAAAAKAVAVEYQHGVDEFYDGLFS